MQNLRVKTSRPPKNSKTSIHYERNSNCIGTCNFCSGNSACSSRHSSDCCCRSSLSFSTTLFLECTLCQFLCFMANKCFKRHKKSSVGKHNFKQERSGGEIVQCFNRGNHENWRKIGTDGIVRGRDPITSYDPTVSRCSACMRTCNAHVMTSVV